MKGYPVGTKFVEVDMGLLTSHFDVMMFQGKYDDEKNEAFEHAVKQGRYVCDPSKCKVVPYEEDGEPRWGLSLPANYIYPPVVARIESLGEGLEVEDGRSLWNFLRKSKHKTLVVGLTPHTTEREALKEASRGNRPEGGIRRSQQSKQDIRKTVHRAFHSLKMSMPEINKEFAGVYAGQKTIFNKVMREVWSEDNRNRLIAGVIQHADGKGTIGEIAKQLGVTVAALTGAIADKTRGRTKREAFSKTLGKSIVIPTGKAIANIINLKPRVEAKIESGAADYSDVQDGLLQYQHQVEKLLGLVKDVRQTLKNDYGKTFGAVGQ